MIGSLRGTVLERSEDGALVEVAGIGYLVSATPRTLGQLEPGETVFLYVYHHIRDDAQTLYGFLGNDERRAFAVLLGTHGIGPALAMAFLATHTPAALAEIIASGDRAALTLVPGVGPKTADRILVELRNRFNMAFLDPSPADGGGSGAVVSAVRDALVGLGYGTEEIREALRDVPSDGDASSMLRAALKVLGAGRA